MSHFRVAVCPCIKTSLCARPTYEFIFMQIKLVFMRKALQTEAPGYLEMVSRLRLVVFRKSAMMIHVFFTKVNRKYQCIFQKYETPFKTSFLLLV